MNMSQMKQELITLGGGAHALAFQILGNQDDASDAVQDSFAKVLGKPDTYDARKGPLKPWFMRVVRNRCLDLLHRRQPGGDPIELLIDKLSVLRDSIGKAGLSDFNQDVWRKMMNDTTVKFDTLL